MHMSRLARFIPAMVLGMGLAAAPLGLSTGGLDDQAAFAKNGGKGGGGKGGGNGGGGNAGGNGAGNGKGAAGNAAANDAGPGTGGAMSAAADGPGKAFGKVGKDLATANMETADGMTTDGVHASDLGRLNGFMNASPTALEHAAPNSAIGVVANAYREALSAYAGSAGEVPDEAALEAAAQAMALAANKEVTPEVVAAVNAHLAETYPDDPALAGFADPTSPESLAAAETIAALAEGYQAEETDQGLGAGFADDGDVDDDGDDDAGDDLADGGEIGDGGDETTVIQ